MTAPQKKRSAQNAYTLPGDAYTSEEIYQREIERIFRRSWLCVGHASDWPKAGSFKLRTIAGDNLIVVRGDDDRIRAFHNVCRHRGARLCVEDDGNVGRSIRCPYHAWNYDLEGSLKAAPTMAEVAGFDRKDYPLHPVSTDIWGGLVFLNLDPSAAPLRQALEPVWTKFDAWKIDELEVAHRTVYDVEANWKLLFQNYSECYHCPGVHPHLNKLTPFRDSDNDLDEGPILGGPMNLAQGPGGSMTLGGRACAPPLGDVAGDDLGRVYYYTLFPNTFLSLHPDYVLVHRAEALARDHTRITCEWLFHPSAIERPGFDPSGAVEFWDLTNRQDWELCARTQLGVSSSAFVPGPYSELESQLAAFDRYYLGVLGEGGDE